MSKAVKQSIAILAVLLFVSIGVALVTLLEKQKLQNQNKSLSDQVADYQAKQTQLIAEGTKLKDQVQSLNSQLADKEKERSKYQSQYQELKDKYDEINSQVSQLTRERDDFKDRSTTITQERDRLMKEIQNRPEKVVEKIVYKDREPAPAAAPTPAPIQAPVFNQPAMSAANPVPVNDGAAVVAQAQADSANQQKDEAHWAEIFKQKAGLELELDKTKKELDQSAIQIVELKKQSSDFQLEIDKLKNEKEAILRKIKYGEDLADNLSIELARAKNDQKFVGDRVEKMSSENNTLRSQVKQLTDIKLGLEKTIQRLNDDKADIQKKLVESESVIQSRIDDIYKIKKNVDQRFQSVAANKNQVELSPIVVNASGGATTTDNPPAQQASMPSSRAKNEGHIVSINADNNFVIIDIGDKDGAKIGNAYRVFRGNKEIAKIETIQVRRDISAADIKKRVTALQVGDVVR
jgi:predicted  nucleic acid-binding Zn-ribbon protein